MPPPAPRTPQQTPGTLNLEPYNLHDTPYTLNLQPYTLNPKRSLFHTLTCWAALTRASSDSIHKSKLFETVGHLPIYLEQGLQYRPLSAFGQNLKHSRTFSLTHTLSLSLTLSLTHSLSHTHPLKVQSVVKSGP